MKSYTWCCCRWLPTSPRWWRSLCPVRGPSCPVGGCGELEVRSWSRCARRSRQLACAYRSRWDPPICTRSMRFRCWSPEYANLNIFTCSYSTCTLTSLLVLPKLEAEVHRIPRTIHDGFFVRTPFPTKISTAQEKSEMRWKSSYRAFVHYIHGWCRQHALALSRRRICEKSQNAPYFNRHFRWRYLPLKSWVRHDTPLIKVLYGNNNRCYRVNTLALTHRRR